MKALTLLLWSGILAFISSAPTEKPSTDDYTTAKAYLLKYSYLSDSDKDNPDAFEKALINLQHDGDIPKSGKVDKETLELMAMPRCNFGNSNLAVAAYKLQSKWDKSNLTYSIHGETDTMSKEQQKTEIERAIRVWSGTSGLNFEEAPEGGDIQISFFSGYHGDSDPFDGPGNTLAHAYFPYTGGDCHLDKDEAFTFNKSDGINLFQVVAHELGHSLGLDHSLNRNALMAAFYRGYIADFKLPADDISGIQTLYGPNLNLPPTPKPMSALFPATTTASFSSSPPPTQILSTVGAHCQDSRLDAIFSLSNGVTYCFQGDSYFKFSDTVRQLGSPKKIADDWKNLPNNIDAALDVKHPDTGKEEIWFFKGSRIYYYATTGMQIRNPQEISHAMPGLPNDIDAIFTWSGNGKVYVMKGSQYYRILPHIGYKVDSGYPRNINFWTETSDSRIAKALQNGIDAALKYTNGQTYFFKGQEYYKLIDKPLMFDADYPRPVNYWWFGCNA